MELENTPISDDEKSAEYLLLKMLVPALLIANPHRGEIASALREELQKVDHPVSALALSRLEKIVEDFG